MSIRQEKVSKFIKELAAQFIEIESDRTSLITVTRCTVSKDLKRATVFITVLPEERETSALHFLNRKRRDLQQYLRKTMKTKFIPVIDVTIDEGEKNRQRIEKLLK